VTSWHGLSIKNKIIGWRGKTSTWIDVYECDLELGKFVDHFHVLSRRCLRRRKGLLWQKETCKRWTGGKSLWDMVFQTHEDALDENFRTLSSGKTETRRREHSVNTYHKIWRNDDRILLHTWLSFERLNYFENLGCVVKIPKSFGRIKQQNKQGWI